MIYNGIASSGSSRSPSWGSRDRDGASRPYVRASAGPGRVNATLEA